MNYKYISHSDSETQSIGSELARYLKKGDTVLLFGDLGYGKTTFTKGVAIGLNIKGRLTSPTFTIIKKYKHLIHIDLYRIESKKQLDEIGMHEIISDQDSIKIIEWPENMYGALPSKRWEVAIRLDKDNTRVFNINKYE